MPSAAPTVSAFITIALIGSTIEPVISHSTIIVSPTSSADARAGGCEPIACLLVDELGRGAADAARRTAPRRRAGRRRGRRAVAPCGSPSASDVDLRRAGVQRARLAHAAHAGQAARRGRRWPRGAWRGVGDDRDRALALAAGEVAVDGVGDGARALALRDHGGVDRRPGRAQRRQRQHEHQRAGAERDRQRVAHHAVRQPVPAAAGARRAA